MRKQIDNILESLNMNRIDEGADYWSAQDKKIRDELGFKSDNAVRDNWKEYLSAVKKMMGEYKVGLKAKTELEGRKGYELFLKAVGELKAYKDNVYKDKEEK